MFWRKKVKTPKEIEFNVKIDKIEIDLLAGDLPSYIDRLRPMIDSLSKEDKFGLNEKGFFTVETTQEQTEEIIALWNALEPGEPMRCYSPGYRLKFYSRGDLIRTASLCWACNHMKLIHSRNEESWFPFEGRTEMAQNLLDKCRVLMNNKI